jgi:hypothetical protein
MRRFSQPFVFVVACCLSLVAAEPILAQSSLNLMSYEDAAPSQVVPAYSANAAYQPTLRNAQQLTGRSNLNPRPATVAPAFQPPAQPAARPLPSNVQNILGYFGNQKAADTLNKMPQRPVMANRTMSPIRLQTPQLRNKPFDGASNGATVSPYLNLYREEETDSAPNYYAFVRPQLQQQEQNQRSQAALQNLNRQVQRVSVSYGSSAAGVGTGAMPVTGHGARFGDTAQFYSGFVR